ncbi:hypothetical protein FA13DRAFT_1742498, partial [Coprinellus micaceus]
MAFPGRDPMPAKLRGFPLEFHATSMSYLGVSSAPPLVGPLHHGPRRSSRRPAPPSWRRGLLKLSNKAYTVLLSTPVAYSIPKPPYLTFPGTVERC